MPRVRRLLATGIAVQAGAERIVSIYDRGRQARDLDLVVKPFNHPPHWLAPWIQRCPNPPSCTVPGTPVFARGVDDADAVTHSRSRPRIVTFQDRENGKDLVA